MNDALRTLARFRVAAVLITTLGTALGVAAQGNIAINTTGAAAAPQAMLDISSLTKGLLIPRMNSFPAATPEGLTGYLTTGVRGFYVVKNGTWQLLGTGKNGWDLYGNALLDPANPNPDFIGTTDSSPMYFRTNNAHRMKLDGGSGNLSVGHTVAYTAQQRLDINGALSMYYATGSTVPEASQTTAAGVFRYQPFGTVTGTVNYQYGTGEIKAVGTGTPANVLNATNNYPLQYAAHWGNVDGTALQQGATGPPVLQPRNNGWRAFENPYTEKIAQPWTHFAEAVCTSTAGVEAIVPQFTGGPARVSSVDPLVTPAPGSPGANSLWYRRQYLYLAREVGLELAQLSGAAGTYEGLCPGGPVTKILFDFGAVGQRNAIPGNVTVRNAPLGLNALNGFDNTPDNSGTMGCGTIGAVWPSTAVAGWETINLSTPFKWDGHSNVLVEVAVNSPGFPPLGPQITTRPVTVTNTGFNATYGMNTTTPPTAFLIPDPSPGPGWGCNLTLNVSTRLPDNVPAGNPAYTYGSSQLRPIIKFMGTVAKLGPTGPNYTTGTGNYISYPGALVLEDGTISNTTIPWGMWRPNHPVGNSYYSYKGFGTISAQRGVFDNGSRLNDHVFDRAFDGRVAPGDAAHFGEQTLLPLRELENYTRTNRHLPTMKGREEWDRSGGFSLGDLTNQLWATTETHALYVTELHDKLNVIEMLTNERPITTAEFCTAQQQLANMPEYTDAQKARLIASLRQRSPLTPLSR